MESGKFGTDSARSMLRLSVGVVIGMAAAAVVLAALHWALLPMLLAITLPKGWGAVRSARLSAPRLHASPHWCSRRLYEELLFLTDTEDAIKVAGENAIPTSGRPLPAPAREGQTEGVSFTYPGADGPSLKGVSVREPRGKVTALVGSNGSGKTTLTKVLAGLLLPSEGNRWWVARRYSVTSCPESPSTPASSPTSLWRHRDFRRYLTGQAASVAGSSITQMALPVLAVLHPS